MAAERCRAATLDGVENAMVGVGQAVRAAIGRATHRVAISNNRLLSVDDAQVRFRYRDRAAGNQVKEACLPADEFLRRFLLHVLPKGLQRIRHYGLLAGRNKGTMLARCRELLGADPPAAPEKKSTADWLLLLLGIDVLHCPRCGQVLEHSELPPQRAGNRALNVFTRTSDEGHLVSPAHAPTWSTWDHQ